MHDTITCTKQTCLLLNDKCGDHCEYHYKLKQKVRIMSKGTYWYVALELSLNDEVNMICDVRHRSTLFYICTTINIFLEHEMLFTWNRTRLLIFPSNHGLSAIHIPVALPRLTRTVIYQCCCDSTHRCCLVYPNDLQHQRESFEGAKCQLERLC